MDVIALVLAVLSLVVFIWPAPPMPIPWGLALLTAALIAQWTTLGDASVNW